MDACGMANPTLPLQARVMAAMLIALAAWGGCHKSPMAATQTISDDAYAVQIDPREARDAADRPSADGTGRYEVAADSAARGTLPRELAFEMAGTARVGAVGGSRVGGTRAGAEAISAGPGEENGAERERAAARQVAIIEAFAQALIEARRLRGQPTSDFTARLGPRLTIYHRSLGDGFEIEVVLVRRGEETHFEVKRGVLQHEPRNGEAVARLFEETNGEFALLESRWLAGGDECLARVACFRPVGLDKPAGPSREAVEALARQPDGGDSANDADAASTAPSDQLAGQPNADAEPDSDSPDAP